MLLVWDQKLQIHVENLSVGTSHCMIPHREKRQETKLVFNFPGSCDLNFPKISGSIFHLGLNPKLSTCTKVVREKTFGFVPCVKIWIDE